MTQRQQPSTPAPRTGNKTSPPKRPLATPRRSLPIPSPSVPSPRPATHPRPAAQGGNNDPLHFKPSPRCTLRLNTGGRDTPRTGTSTPRALTPKASAHPNRDGPVDKVSSPLRQSFATRSSSSHDHSESSESWAADQPLGPNGFPEIYSEPTNWDDPITEEDWELRTETANGVQDDNVSFNRCIMLLPCDLVILKRTDNAYVVSH